MKYLESINDRFKLFLDEVGLINRTHIQEIDKLKSSEDSLKDKIAENKHLSERGRKLNEDLLDKIQSTELSMQELVSKSKECDAILSELRKKEELLDERQEVLVVERNRLNKESIDLSKREKLLEMEERRIKLFEHRLNLVAEDEQIKKKLKEIE